MKVIVFMFLAIASTWAGMSPDIVIEGRISDFDANRVKVIYDDGKVAYVPRKAISKQFKIRPGAYVRTIIKSDFLAKEIGKAQKKKK